MSTATAEPGTERISFEEYLAAYDGTRAEWVDGSVVAMRPASDRHQDIAEFLGAMLHELVEQTGAGVVRTSAVTMKLGNVARVPDLLFLSSEHGDRRKPTFIDGPADLVIEIVSPESRGRDRGEKFYEYEQAGVREYWLADPLRETVELYRLDEKGRYPLVSPSDASRLESEVLRGFWIDPAWLWGDELPTLRTIRGKWGLE
jgi:Uma2 family endonuclease